MFLRQIFDPYLAQYAYLIGCQKTGEALIIDPERDIDRYQKIAEENGLKITAATETHIHADFVGGLQEFSKDSAVKLYLSEEGGEDWSYNWAQKLSNVTYLKNDSIFHVGNIKIHALHTPGHTPEHLSFLITDQGGGANQPMVLVSGDFLFVGDVGRPDLLESAAGIKNIMEPSARTLQESLTTQLQNLPDYLQILPAHGAGSACGKTLGAVPISTLGYEKKFNPAYKMALENKEEFVKEILRDQPEPPPYFATMKKVNRDGIKITGGIPHPEQLKAEDLTKLINNQEVKIIDARDDRAAFNQGHFKNALNAPLHSSFFTAATGSYLEPTNKIILALENSQDLDLAVRQLYRIGYDQIIGWILIEDLRVANLLNEKINSVSFADFNAEQASNIGEIIDVRSAAEFNHGHITGAKSFPYTRLKARLSDLPKNTPLYIHCGTGKRAGLAASFLKSAGYKVVHIDGNYSYKSL